MVYVSAKAVGEVEVALLFNYFKGEKRIIGFTSSDTEILKVCYLFSNTTITD